MEDLLKTLSDIADAVTSAVRLIPTLEERGKDIEIGADGTPTSEVDKVAENTVLDYIVRNAVPLNVLSEEIGYVDYGYDEVLILDPIDGSSNAAAGVPLFTISMGVGSGSLSGIHTAYLRNLTTGESIWARRGEGAFKDGRRIHVRTPDMKELFMMIYMGNGASPRAFELAKRVKSSREYGCASLEMALVAEGQADAYLLDSERYNRGTRVVDIAASYLILKEAGGRIFDLSGKDLDMPLDLSVRSNFLAVSDPVLYSFVMKSSGPVRDRPVYGLTANPNSADVQSLARRVVDAMKGERMVFDEAIAGILGTESGDISTADVIITIGGDGTILRAAQGGDAVILGINNGGVGFLADVSPDDIETALARVRAGEYTITERFKIDAYLDGVKMGSAVNEIVVHTDTVAKIRQFRVLVDGHLATEVRADGIIVSTPVGSTGYAMSLGAPMMDPRVEALVVVPIAAYKFASRPIITSSDSKVTIECVLDRGCVAVVDGQSEQPVSGGARLDFVRSPSKFRVIDLGTDFYTRVREKLVNNI